MSNVPNPYNNVPGPSINAHPGPYQYSQVPTSQMPGMKQDADSNSPVPVYNAASHMNHYSQSANSSPAFNQPGMAPSLTMPMRPPIKPVNQNPMQNIPPSSSNPRSHINSSPSPYPPTFQQQRQVNDNAPPLISSSLNNQPLVNGPPVSGPPNPISGPPGLRGAPGPISGVSAPISGPPSSIPINPSTISGPRGPISGPPGLNPGLPGPNSGPPNPISGFTGPAGPPGAPPFGQPPFPTTSGYNPVGARPPPTASYGQGPFPPQVQGPPTLASLPPGPLTSQPNIPFSGSAFAGPPRNSPLMSGPPVSIPPSSGPSLGPSTGPLGPPSGPLAPPSGPLGPPKLGLNGPSHSQPSSVLPPISGQLVGPLKPLGSGAPSLPPIDMSRPARPPITQAYPPQNGPGMPQSGINPGSMGPNAYSGAQSLPPQPMGQMAPPGPSGPTNTNMQNRYPPMPQGNYMNHQPQMPPQPMNKQYPQQYSAQGLTQQMGGLSVTKQGFDQLWGHHMIDLMQTRHILPEYPEDPPEIRLPPQFADAPNCSPEIFRCTINRIPETNSLLQKSRLPLGILIHPFKDLNHLPVIQCTTIVRCRACRTYINPFVYFVDAKRWKCNLCFRVNDLPEEFQYDPVSKSYGDPSRRPEIKSATIEFIAPGEYMLRPPQPAVYLFLFDVSQIARDSGYLQVVCETLKENLDQLPGDARTQVGFICYDAHVHYYQMSDGLTRPKELTILDIDDVFLPSPESLLVNLGEHREMIKELLTVLPQRYSNPGVPLSALGAALQAAYKLMAPTGGRITVFQTCLPNVGPGALQSREDPNARSSKDVAHLSPATDFYKRLALDCSSAQVAADLFLLSSQYCDLATLSGMSKFSAGTVYHVPLFKATRAGQAPLLARILTRYLTRKIGFEAVMRVRCTRGITIHTFHGNFFVRSTDLLSLPNVSPDAGFGMQLSIEESLSDLNQVCFQAALLYTSSKGERRIRVHTLALPIASSLTDVLHAADQQCIVGLLSKMAVDRSSSASMSEAREALMNVAVDVLSAHRLSQNLPAGAASAALHAPYPLRLLPLYLLALLKRKAFRTGTSTRLDDRVADMCDMKTLPLPHLVRAVYPDLYPVHNLAQYERKYEGDADEAPDPPRLHLTAERINSNGAYLLDDGDTIIIYVCHNASPAYLSETFGVASFNQVADEARSLPRLETDGNELLHAFVDKLNDDRPYASNLIVLRDNSPSKLLFTERLVDDRVESAFSYYEFLQHIKNQVK